jgi:hypothetical protein
LNFTPMEYQQLLLEARRLAADKEAVSSEYAQKIEQLVFRAMALEKLATDDALDETTTWQLIEKQENARDVSLPEQALQEAQGYWESQIIKASESVPLDPNKPDWMYSSEFNDFLFSWLELKSFHESHKPSQVISASVISELIPFIRFLRRIIVDKQQNDATRQYATEQLEALEGVVESTAWAASADDDA